MAVVAKTMGGGTHIVDGSHREKSKYHMTHTTICEDDMVSFQKERVHVV